MTTPSRATSLRPRRRRRSFGLRAIELGVILAVGAAAIGMLVAKVDELPAKGGSAACTISQLAADRAAVAYFAGEGAGSWPKDLQALTTGVTPILELPHGVEHTDPWTVTSHSWTLTMQGGGASQPTFRCS